MEKKTRELFGYSFAQWKWNVQDPGNFGKFSVFRIFQIFQNFQFLQHSILNMIAGKLEWGSRLDESSRRKPGWRFTAGFEYGCAVQLVGTQKNVDLFVILGVFFFELMRSFFTVLLIHIFPIKFSEKENQGANRLFICSTKVKCPGPGKFSKKLIFWWYFWKFSKFSIFL